MEEREVVEKAKDGGRDGGWGEGEKELAEMNGGPREKKKTGMDGIDRWSVSDREAELSPHPSVIPVDLSTELSRPQTCLAICVS